jgi:aspartyl-tRNA(Asn)/glutamyl-tRNA(Gln) amidotransferase subunit C
MLSREEVCKIARLARLDLTPEEVEIYRVRLGRVLEHVKELSALKIPEEAYVRHVPKDVVAFREDKSVSFTDVAAMMKNAPAADADHFLLPTVVEHT